MRYRFLPTGRQHDEAARQQVLDRIDAWWSAFGEKRDDLVALFTNQQSWDLGAWMQETLRAIDPGLMWEFGPGLEGGHRLVVTPEVERRLRPLVDTVLERCPGFEDWTFHPYRLRESVEHAHMMLESRQCLPIHETSVVVTSTDECLVDLAFYSKRYKPKVHDAASHSVFVASESILGEETLDTWIGEISVHKGNGKRQGALPLSQMAQAVEDAIGHVQASLPSKPIRECLEELRGTIWELNPDEADVYPGRSDLVVARSSLPLVWTAAHSGVVFESSRYSRCDEVFAYVKTDGIVDLSGQAVDDRAAMEDAIEARLLEGQSGAVFGGGTGKQYSYIDLALTDPDAGIQAVLDALRAGGMVKETWIQFFDARYASEWVGLYDDSPPPPGFED